MKEILRNQIKKNWRIIVGFQLSIIISSLFSAIFYVEILRKITNSILIGCYDSILRVLFVFLIAIMFLVVVNINKKTYIFMLKKSFIFEMEDKIFDCYSEQEYWAEKEKKEILGSVRKIVPEAVDLFINQFILTLEIVVVILSGYLYGRTIHSQVLTISVVVIIFMVMFSSRGKSKVSELYKEFNENNSKMYNLLWEQINNLEIAQFLNRNKVFEEYENCSRTYLHTLLKIKKATNGAELFSQFGSVVLIVLVALLGGIFVLRGHLNYSDVLALIILIQTLSASFFRIPIMLQGWKKVKGYFVKLNDGLRREEQYHNEFLEEKIFLKDKIETIVFEKVSYSYPDMDKLLFDKIELEFEKGKFYVIAGESGCGKTTMLQLMVKLIANQQGKIKVNGIDIENLEKKDYWKHLAFVGQNPVVISGTALYNITMDEEDYDVERMEKAVEEAMLKEFIKKSSLGFKTGISDTILSKGEQKKLNLARAFYRRSEVLLLDEITEGLDPKSEKHILNILRQKAKENMLIVCTSHKVATLKSADYVIYIKDGIVQGSNSHEEWIKKSESYRGMIGRNC